METKPSSSETEKMKISVKNLNFYYGKFHALKDISLEIPEKKVTAFIGPSGCGKSTLLRTFNRMFELYPEQRAEGEIFIDGEDVIRSKLNISLIRAKVGMVFQKPTPFPMSIYENICKDDFAHCPVFAKRGDCKIYFCVFNLNQEFIFKMEKRFQSNSIYSSSR